MASRASTAHPSSSRCSRPKRGRFPIRLAGEFWTERRYLSLAYAEEAPAVIPLFGEVARAGVEGSARWWRDWAGRGADRGPYREAIRRSAWALKLLTDAPSGTIIATPTASPPEKLAGVRNWDYRYCRLRGGSVTVRTLFALGYRVESRQLITWWLGATIGLVQALFVLGAAMPVLPACPRGIPGWRPSNPARPRPSSSSRPVSRPRAMVGGPRFWSSWRTSSPMAAWTRFTA